MQPPPAQAAPALPDTFTNNQIIDAFYDASVKLGLSDWTLLEKAGLSLGELVKDRNGRYAARRSRRSPR